MLDFSHFYRWNTLILGQFPCFYGIFHIKPFDRPIFLNYLENLQRTLEDKSFLAPLGFDTRGTENRLWLLRGNSTVEAWDEALTAPVSRHRLKGRVTGQHKDGQGRLCVTTWDERKNVFRVFRLT